MAASTTPKKTGIFGRLFKGSGSHSKPKKNDTLATAAQQTTASPQQSPVLPSMSPRPVTKHASESATCHCCSGKITLRQSFRKSKCHKCQNKVCKKCYVVNKLCHKCVVRQRYDINNMKDLLRIDCDKLGELLELVHCDQAKIQLFKNNGDAMVRELLTICELKGTLMEFEAALNSADNAHNRRNASATKPVPRQPEMHGNGIFIDLHPPSTHRQVAQVESVPIVQPIEDTRRIVNGNQSPKVRNDPQDLEMLAIPQADQLKMMDPPIPTPIRTSNGFVFIADNVIVEEDEEETTEVEAGHHHVSRYTIEELEMKLENFRAESSEIDYSEFKDPVEDSITPMYVTPPQTPNSKRKSQLEIFYSTTEIPQMETKPQIATISTTQHDHLEVEEHQEAMRKNILDYKPYFNRVVEDLTVIRKETEIRRMTLFELKTILQKRGRPITGLILYEDFVQKVISVWKEELKAKEDQAERERQSEVERKAMEEQAAIERQLEEQAAIERQLEVERQVIEEQTERNRQQEVDRKDLEEQSHKESQQEVERKAKEQQEELEKKLEEEKTKMVEDKLRLEEFERFAAEMEAAEISKAERDEEEEVDRVSDHSSIVEQMEQMDFEMLEVQMKLEEIEDEWKAANASFEYKPMMSPGLPEVVEVDENSSSDSVASLPTPPPTPALHLDVDEADVTDGIVEEVVVKEDGKLKCTGFQEDDIFK